MKTLYVIACCLFLAAIVLDGYGKHYASTAAQISAKAVEASESDRAFARQESDAGLHKCALLNGLGMVTAAAGLPVWLASLILAKRRGKRMSPVLPLVLFVGYLLLFCVMV